MRAVCYVFTYWQLGIHPAGLPHSETHGSKRMCRSPWLIAACRVLHRLLAPRHSSCALRSLINLFLRQVQPCLGNSFFVITDSLSCQRLSAAEIESDSALFEVAFTYYPICRCQRTSGTSYIESHGRLGFRVSSSRSNTKKRSLFASLLLPFRAFPRSPLDLPFFRWWAWQDLNLRPCAYQAHALTN